jgi:hypothetical protein
MTLLNQTTRSREPLSRSKPKTRGQWFTPVCGLTLSLARDHPILPTPPHLQVQWARHAATAVRGACQIAVYCSCDNSSIRWGELPVGGLRRGDRPGKFDQLEDEPVRPCVCPSAIEA